MKKTLIYYFFFVRLRDKHLLEVVSRGYIQKGVRKKNRISLEILCEF